jgi:HPt (histidine-containing phosphotransfer) domain-containing protein
MGSTYTRGESRWDDRWDELALDRLRRFGGDGLVREMLSLFIAQVPLRLSAARDGIARGDANGVRQAAHAMRSSCAQLGAARMAEIATALDERASDGALDDAPAMIEELARQFDGYVTWIDDRGAR